MKSIRSLTSLRFFAALWVAMLHFRLGDLANDMPASFLFSTGYLGVPVFFILSGFILGYTYLNSINLGRLKLYFVARFARIYPAHILVLLSFPAVLVPLRIWPHIPTDTVYTFGLSALLLQSWGFTKSAIVWNQPSWSVSSEFFCYLVFPALALALKRVPRWAILPLLVFSAWVIVTGGLGTFASELSVPVRTTLHFFLLFVVGVLLFKVFDSFSYRPGAALSSLCIIGSVAIVIWRASIYQPGNSTDNLWIYSAMAMLILILAAGRGPVITLLGIGPLVYLGEISYSLYLVHCPLREIMYTVARTRHLPFALEIAITVAVSAAMFHYVEQPCRRLIRNLGTRSNKVMGEANIALAVAPGGSAAASQ
jgi:peptidoglycan/LPS O-acetylase OafA/YrhL